MPGDAYMWPNLRLPRYQIVADASRTSRSYVLTSLRALHLDLRLVARGIGSCGGSRASRLLAFPRLAGGGSKIKPDMEGSCPIRARGCFTASRWGPLGGVTKSRAAYRWRKWPYS